MITCSNSNLNNIDKATPTNYNLIFPLIPTETTIGANNPFVMNIHSAILPSVSIAQEDLRWQGNRTKGALIPMEFDPWLVSFMVDSKLYNWKLLFKWMSFINNNNDKIAEQHKNHSVDCSLIVTDNYSNAVLEVIFVSIWPSVLGEVSFSQREGDIVLESTINFNYDYFYVKEIQHTFLGTSIISSSSSSSESDSSSSSSSSSSLSNSSSSSSLSFSVSASPPLECDIGCNETWFFSLGLSGTFIDNDDGWQSDFGGDIKLAGAGWDSYTPDTLQMTFIPSTTTVDIILVDYDENVFTQQNVAHGDILDISSLSQAIDIFEISSTDNSQFNTTFYFDPEPREQT